MIRPVARLTSVAVSGRRILVGCVTAVGARIALLCGRWRLFRRDVDGAVTALDTATRRAPESLAPWVHLARAHLRNRNWVAARRALARAKDLAPSRFEAVAVRALRRDGFELAVLLDPVPAAVAPAASRPNQGPAGSRPERAAVKVRTQESTPSHPLGDCRDLDEYARFRSMPPITPAEIESIDWDAIADDLLEG